MKIFIIVIIILLVSFAANIIMGIKLSKTGKIMEKEIDATYSQINDVKSANANLGTIKNEINEFVGEKTSVAEYLKDKQGLIKDIKNLEISGDILLDCVLTDKKRTATESGVEAIYNVHVDEKFPLDDVDKIRLFTNMLDNAIEAAKQVEGSRYIKLDIMRKGDNTFIAAENSKIDSVNVLENNFATTKSDASNHGRGIKIIRQIVSKYKGMLDFEDNGDSFNVRILI